MSAAMDGSAIILAPRAFGTPDSKTAHGLVRGTERFRIVGVIDPDQAGKDAGTVLDGRPRNIPVFASLADSLAALPQRPEFCIVGVATHGGRLSAALREALLEAIEAGISVVNGLHE